MGVVAVVLGLLLVAARYQAPIVIWAIWGTVTAALAGMVLLNPISGSRIANGTWTV